VSKKLTIVRHAKSDWGSVSIGDFDRPLNKRGIRDLPVMAKLFTERVSDVDKVLSSPALRAKSTAIEFSKFLGISENNILFFQDLYLAELTTLMKQLNHLSDSVNHAIIFGHNPGLSDLGTHISGEYLSFPTCAILELELHVKSWSEVSSGTGSILNFDYPKRHNELQ